MATWRGQGGAVTVLGNNTALGVSKWTADETVVLANKTNSKSAGHKQRQGTVRDSTFSIELPWDDTQDPEALGLVPGSVIALTLNKGESGKKMSTSQAVIEKRGWVNDEDEDLVRLVLSGYCNVKYTHT